MSVDKIEKTVEVVKEVVEKNKDLAEFSIDKMEQFFDAAQKVLAQYGGDAVDLGLNVLRIDAVSQLFLPLITIIICAVVLIKLSGATTVSGQYIKSLLIKGYDHRTGAQDNILLYCGFSKEDIWDKFGDTRQKEIEDMIYTIPFFSDANIPRVILFVLTSLASTFAVVELSNIWAWTGIFYPELYAVHKFLL